MRRLDPALPDVERRSSRTSPTPSASASQHAPRTSTRASSAPASWRCVVSKGPPWTLASASNRFPKIGQGALLDRRGERRSLDQGRRRPSSAGRGAVSLGRSTSTLRAAEQDRSTSPILIRTGRPSPPMTLPELGPGRPRGRGGRRGSCRRSARTWRRNRRISSQACLSRSWSIRGRTSPDFPPQGERRLVSQRRRVGIDLDDLRPVRCRGDRGGRRPGWTRADVPTASMTSQAALSAKARSMTVGSSGSPNQTMCGPEEGAAGRAERAGSSVSGTSNVLRDRLPRPCSASSRCCRGARGRSLDPALAWRPSTFWVMRVNAGKRSSHSARMAWPGVGADAGDDPPPPVVPFPDELGVAGERFGRRQVLGPELAATARRGRGRSGRPIRRRCRPRSGRPPAPPRGGSPPPVRCLVVSISRSVQPVKDTDYGSRTLSTDAAPKSLEIDIFGEPAEK